MMQTDSLGQVFSKKFDLFQTDSHIKLLFQSNIQMFAQNDDTFTYRLQLEDANCVFNFVENDSLTVKVSSKTHQLQQKYPMLMRSPYAQLIANSNQYCIKQDEVEFLDTFSPVLQVTSNSTHEVLVHPDQFRLTAIIPTQCNVEAQVAAHQELLD